MLSYLDAPSTENQNRNSPSSTGFQTLEEQNAKILLEDIGNTEVTGLDVTYEAESTVEAVPGDYEVTVVYTLLEDT